MRGGRCFCRVCIVAGLSVHAAVGGFKSWGWMLFREMIGSSPFLVGGE